MTTARLSLAALAAGALFLTGCETTDMQMGSQSAKTVATGSAAGTASANASGALERCSAPLGTVSLIENQSAGWYTILRNEYKLPPTANLLRLLVQQSNCFVVVERGAPGMNGDLRIFPELGVVVVALSNLDPPAAGYVVDYYVIRMPLD